MGAIQRNLSTVQNSCCPRFGLFGAERAQCSERARLRAFDLAVVSSEILAPVGAFVGFGRLEAAVASERMARRAFGQRTAVSLEGLAFAICVAVAVGPGALDRTVAAAMAAAVV